MATLKKLQYDSYDIVVEASLRDGEGNTISTTYLTNDAFNTTIVDYAKLTDLPTDYLTSSDLSSYVTLEAYNTQVDTFNTAINGLETSIANVYTKAEVDTLISSVDHSSYVTLDTLADYVTTTSLTTTLGNYVTTNALSDYYNKTDVDEKLSEYTTNNSLTQQLSNYATRTDLIDFITTDETYNYAIPKLIPTFSKYSSLEQMGFFTYDIINGCFASTGGACTGCYISAYDISFHLSFDMGPIPDDYYIIMFQKKRKRTKSPNAGSRRKKGMVFTRSGGSLEIRSNWNYVTYTDSSTPSTLFKTEWKLNDLTMINNLVHLEDAIAYGSSYIPMLLAKRRGDYRIPLYNPTDGTYLHDNYQSAYADYKYPEIAFAICRLDSKGHIIARGPMTIIKVGISSLDSGISYKAKFKWIS